MVAALDGRVEAQAIEAPGAHCSLRRRYARSGTGPMPTVYFEDLEIGSVHLGGECVCDREEMLEFGRRNDPWPFHVDEAAAARSPFGGIVASGGYIVTLWYRMLVEIYNTISRRRRLVHRACGRGKRYACPQ